jgi:hypothetical protein
LAKSVINNNLSTSQSTIFSENPQSMDDMNAVKVDRISVSDIITNIDIIINNKTCHLCYKKLSKLNEEEINNINAEIKKIEKMKKILTKEIESNKDEIRDEEKEEKKEDAKAQEEASKRLIEDNIKLQKEFDKNIEILKNINEEEKKILDEVNKLNLDTLHISENYEIEKSIQQKNQFEQITLLNNNLLESLFDIQINEKYGVINGCKMNFKNYSSFSDIFSGWGHILLLTNIINLKAKKYLNISHIKDPYKIFNLGDYSYILNTIDKKKYLFYERNSNLNDDSKANELNQSMSQYLQVLKDIDDKMKKINGNVSGLSNFVIDSTCINHYPIKLDINVSEDYDWALCIKSLLILLKYYINVLVCKENEELKKIIEQ